MINYFIKLIPVLLLAGCATTYQPREPQSVGVEAVPAVSSDSVVDNCFVGWPTEGGSQTIVYNAYTLNNNSGKKFANKLGCV